MTKSEIYTRLFDKCQIFLEEKQLIIKPNNRLGNGTFS